MTHYSVTVAIDASVEPGPALYQAVAEALEPYDENLAVEPYVEVTRLQAENDEKFRKWWKEADEKAAAKGLPPRTYELAAVSWWGGTVDEDGNVISQSNPDGVWDWWVIGGRFAGDWVLKPGAARALPSEPSAFGYTDEIRDARRTDAARKGEIEPESIATSYAFVDLDGKWHQRGRVGWFGTASNEVSGEDWAVEFTRWFTSLPADVWVVRIDAHV